MPWSAFICHLCAYILVWAFSMRLYGALHIVCQHIYVHSIHFVRQTALSAGIPPVSVCSPEIRELGVYYPPLSVLHLVASRGPGALPTGVFYPQLCAYNFFLFAGFRSVRYDSYVGLGPKLHTCILFTVYVHYMFMNATSYIRFISQYQLNQSI